MPVQLVELADQNGRAIVWPHVINPLTDWARLLEVTIITVGVIVIVLLAALVTALIWSQRA